jgi:hypothetical protein
MMRPSDAHVLLAAVESPRKIVINLLYCQTAGEPLGEERMRELIEAAGAEKLAKALERLQAVRTPQAGVLSDLSRGARLSASIRVHPRPSVTPPAGLFQTPPVTLI